MKDDYTPAFYEVVKDTQASSGYDLPHHIEAYIVMLLCEFVDRKDIPPEKTFAEQFLAIQNNHQAKQLGDVCLFVSGVFPRLKQRAGLNRRYYQDIGSTSYEIASTMNEDLFPTLANHFVFLSDFIEIVVNSQKLPRNTLFR